MWCSVVCCGAAQCSVVWCSVVWCSVVCCGAAQCSLVWCSVVWCSVVWCSVCVCGGGGVTMYASSKRVPFQVVLNTVAAAMGSTAVLT